MKVLLIRHTRVDVPPGTCYGQTDVPLTPTFEEEATDVRLRLTAYGAFTHVFTSPLSRARRLAAFCGYPDAICDPRLMEMNMGEWEMQRYEEIDDPALQLWYDDYLHLPATGGESFDDVRARVGDFLDELRHLEKTDVSTPRVAIFTHGGVAVAAALHAHLVSEAHAFSIQPPPGGILEIEV